MARIFGRLAVPLELLILGDGYFAMLELAVGDVVVLLLDVLARLHQFRHLVAVEDLLLVLGTGGLLALVPHLALAVLLLHLARPLHVVLDLLAELLLLAQVLQDVGAVLDRVEILQEGVVLGELGALRITGIHLLFHT